MRRAGRAPRARARGAPACASAQAEAVQRHCRAPAGSSGSAVSPSPWISPRADSRSSAAKGRDVAKGGHLVVAHVGIRDIARRRTGSTRTARADAHHDGAVVLQRGARGIDDAAGVDRGRDVDDLDHARLLVDRDAHRAGALVPVRRGDALAGVGIESASDCVLASPSSAGNSSSARRDAGVPTISTSPSCVKRRSLGAASSSSATAWRSAAAAAPSAAAIMCVERLEVVRVSNGVTSVSIVAVPTSRGSTPSASAASCESTAVAPWPISAVARVHREAAGGELDAGTGAARRLHALHQRAQPGAAPICRPADLPRRGLETLGDAEIVHDLARREAVAVAQHVLQAQLERIDAEPLGEQVDALLRCPGRLRGRIAAERAVARAVRVDAVGVDLDVVEAVRPDRGPAALRRDVRTGVGIGARVPLRPHPAGHEAAVARRAETHPRARRMAVEREEELVAREHELDRGAGAARERGRDGLDARERLGAEGAAHRQRDDADVGLRQAERAGELAADVERGLRAGPDRQATVPPLGEACVRLHRGVLRRGRRPFALDDDLGLVEARLPAAADESRTVADVGPRQRAHPRPGTRAARDLLDVVDEGSTGGERGVEVRRPRADRPTRARRRGQAGRRPADRGRPRRPPDPRRSAPSSRAPACRERDSRTARNRRRLRE